MKLAIVKNEDPFDHQKWIDACLDYNKLIEFKVFDLTIESWLRDITQYSPDILLLKPSGKTSLFRTLYQERIEILVNELGFNTVPSLEEIRIYENKKYFAYWAQANKIPHVNTWIFYNKNEAINILRSKNKPLVAKISIGSSGKGVEILKSNEHLKSYIKKAFSSGVYSKTGPKLKQGKVIQRIWKNIIQPKKLINRLNTYKEIGSDPQKGFIIVQEYIEHDYEWRVVRIGDSFFAHKKIILDGKSSGSLRKKYENPPFQLLDFVYDITEKFKYHCVALDIFEPKQGQYLINEIQCIFGQSEPNQMLVDNKPGRYKKKDQSWIFEEGTFNTNASYDLRLNYAIQKYQSQ